MADSIKTSVSCVLVVVGLEIIKLLFGVGISITVAIVAFAFGLGALWASSEAKQKRDGVNP